EKDTFIVAGTNALLISTIGSYVEMDAITADTDWTYTVGAADATTFTATATRSSGTYNAKTITLNQAGTFAGTFVL
ncbi:MAG: hypothetical protein WCY09_05530, partial [Candidatus Omnitrophota bacterium]